MTTTEITAQPRAGSSIRSRLRAPIGSPHRIALAGVLLLAAFLGFFQLDREGYSNPYYAATVRSMLSSWHAFFYGSYDAAGFVTVDKPPLGFWIQAASAFLFGFSGLSLLLPQVLAGIASVAVLYRLVARTFGAAAGLIAALALAVTPIVVATNRNNTVDSLLVLTTLLAAWAVILAAERGSLRWLLLGFALVGVGFNIKMLQAFLVLPGLVLLYLAATPRRPAVRATHLAAATIVLVAVSLSWAVVVDLTPAERRPYVGGSRSNSAVELAVGYNGLSRLLGIGAFGPAAIAPAPGGPGTVPPGNGQGLIVPPGCAPSAALPAASPPASTGAGGIDVAASPRPAPEASGPGNTCAGPGGPVGAVTGIGGENGEPGPLRLLNEQLGGQISWLLPLALVGALSLARPLRRSTVQGPRGRALLLWGGWFVGGAAFFSVAGFWHRYYLVMLAPPIAALVGAGLVALWRDYRGGGVRRWALPIALVVTGLVQAAFLAPYPDWAAILVPVSLGGAAVAAAGLVLLRVRATPAGADAVETAGDDPDRSFPRPPRRTAVGAAGVLATTGFAALLAAPGVWAALPVWNAPGDMLPAAGPLALLDAPFAPPVVAGGSPGGHGGSDGRAPGGGRSPRIVVGAGPSAEVDPKLVEYLRANRGDARFLVATSSAGSASPIILATGEAVMSLHGFGADQILTEQGLAERVQRGEVRFFLINDGDGIGLPVAGGPGPGGRGGVPDNGGAAWPPPAGVAPPGVTADVIPPAGGSGGPPGVSPVHGVPGPGGDAEAWVREHCQRVPRDTWSSSGSAGGGVSGPADVFGETLYDCRAPASGGVTP